MRPGIWLALPLLFGLVAHAFAAGEVYKWVDSGGRVHYSDQPPPASARGAEQMRGKGNVVEVDKESFDMRLARERNPVQLYSAACGPLCSQAEEHLRKRGIAFSLRDPSKDPEHGVALRQLTGALEVPVIVVGKTHQKGYEASSWDSLLDAAGYPRTPLIPERAPPR
jgi:glutaredoxin